MNPHIKLSKLPSIIRERRLSAKLSLSQLAKLCDMDVPHLSRIERLEMSPSLDTLERIFDELHITVEPKQTKKFDDNENGSDSEVR